MKNTTTIILVLVALFVLIYWKQIKAFFAYNKVPANGTPCKTTTGADGTISNGACIPNDNGGGPGGGEPAETTQRSVPMLGGADLLLRLPPKAAMRYTESNPYEYEGCKYVFYGEQRVSGILYTRLKRIYC